ncbi:hypothetical protein ABC383_02450 [Noviherbaspirillum sp. 1P10PC]
MTTLFVQIAIAWHTLTGEADITDCNLGALDPKAMSDPKDLSRQNGDQP